jgi:hypothetical protein
VLIEAGLPQLASGGRAALVIGLGGLGQVAGQMLTALTGFDGGRDGPEARTDEASEDERAR